MADKEWRAEADDEWLAEHRSNFMGRVRRRFGTLGGLGNAVSNAETGPFGGAPRNPDLRVDAGDKAYATVRYTTDQIAYTTTSINPDECRRCGQPLSEKHKLEYVQHGHRTSVGAVRTCRSCEADSWLLRSGMPTAARARRTARRNVL